MPQDTQPEEKKKTDDIAQKTSDKLDATNVDAAGNVDEPAKAGVKTLKRKSKGAKVIKMIRRGTAYVQSTYNNTIVTLTDQNGNVLGWSSSGKCGFKGPKKSTPYAAGIVAKDAIDKVGPERGLREVNVFVKGVGSGREAAVRALQANGLTVLLIKDITPMPHNGCRPAKIRRV